MACLRSDDGQLAGLPRGTSNEFEADGFIARVLAAGPEDGPDGYVANRLTQRALDLSHAVCREADERSVAQQPTRCGRRSTRSSARPLQGWMA